MSGSGGADIALACVDASVALSTRAKPSTPAEEAQLAERHSSATAAPSTAEPLAALFDRVMKHHYPSHDVQTQLYMTVATAIREYLNAVELCDIPRSDLTIIREEASDFKNGDVVLKQGTATWHKSQWLLRDHAVLCYIVRAGEPPSKGGLLSKSSGGYVYRLAASWTTWAEAHKAGSTASAIAKERADLRQRNERLEKRVRDLERELHELRHGDASSSSAEGSRSSTPVAASASTGQAHLLVPPYEDSMETLRVKTIVLSASEPPPLAPRGSSGSSSSGAASAGASASASSSSAPLVRVIGDGASTAQDDELPGVFAS